MRYALLLCLTLLGATDRVDAADGIRRCISPDGVSIYTDQPCENFGAVDRLPQPASVPRPENIIAATGFTRRDCARRTDTLLFDLRQAIESDNVNQLAGLYHWPGVGGRSARTIMDRLERLGSRSLASAELVFPDVTPVRDDPAAFPEDTPIENPVGVRIEQSMPGAISPSFVEDLRLVQHAGCWWVRY